jgi:hypothetical protein
VNVFNLYSRFFPARKKDEELSDLVKLLGESPAAVEILQKRETERLQKVRQLSADIKRIQAERDSILPSLRARVETAAAEERDLTDRLEAARKRRASLELDRLGTSMELQGKITSLEGERKALEPSVTRDFIHDAWALIYHLQNELTIEERPGPRNHMTDEVESFTVVSNKNALDEALNYLRAAIREAEAMVTDGLASDQIAHRLEELSKGIPDFKRLKHLSVQRSRPAGVTRNLQ